MGILISGIAGFARLKLEEHRPSEIYAGYLLGFSVMAIVFLIK
jgi:hypothetical protein